MKIGYARVSTDDQTKDLQNKLAAEQQTSQAARAQVELLTAEIAAVAAVELGRHSRCGGSGCTAGADQAYRR